MSDAAAHKVHLPAIVDLDSLETLRDSLLDLVGDVEVVVEGADVERVATNALFALLSAAETARASQSGFSIANASDPLRSAIGRLGLEPQFSAILKG